MFSDNIICASKMQNIFVISICSNIATASLDYSLIALKLILIWFYLRQTNIEKKKDENVHRYAVRGKKERDRKREKTNVVEFTVFC